ncbi:DUF4374 domain-containing protein [Algoriphagus terrigena]|uniref:DUF4374 domain-containing protein n=1 Tax=Algoriphagus terrigena TaxID=344884 RepID=UPI0003FDD0C0|nr:DUF4374 domain-containing protein [Algoriphagus terrigena]
MNTKFQSFALSALFGAGLLVGCSDDPNPIPPGEVGTSRYIIASTPQSSDGVADYLLTAESLTEGTISTLGNGTEQDGTYRYYVTAGNKFFSMLYGQGNPGAVTTYELDGTGSLVKLSNFQSETVHAFAAVGDDIAMVRVARSGEPIGSWFRIDTEQMQIVADGQWDLAAIANNGERAHFSWIHQVGDKLFAPYFSIKGCCGDSFGTAYPDSAWVAVFSYPEMELEKVIKDNRTSFIGRYFVPGMDVDEKGDVYAFSSSVATSNGAITSTLPSAYVKIKKGEYEFDQSYYFNVEEKADGNYITSHVYVGNGKFIATMNDVKGAYDTGKRFGVVDVYNKTFTWITGTPDPAVVQSVTINNYSPKDGVHAYIGITTDQGSWVYEFDASTAQATQGLKVDGGVITAISKLEAPTE